MNRHFFSAANFFRHSAVRRPRPTLHLFRFDSSQTIFTALLLTGISWLPVAILAAANSRASLLAFLSDFATQSRLLLVIPMLIMVEPNSCLRSKLIVEQFLKSGLIPSEEQIEFSGIVKSWQNLRTSFTARVALVVVSYAIVVELISLTSPGTLMSWSTGNGGFRYLSTAGTWFAFVSAPLIVYLVLGWLWEQLLWTRFLAATTRLSLQLVTAHPDCVGGLSFVQSFMPVQYPYGFIVGTIVAGGVANRVVHHGQALGDFKYLPLIVVPLILTIAVGPHCVFVRTLMSAKIRGIFEYDSLALRLGREFEKKWLFLKRSEDSKDPLQVPDFSATIDLYSVVAGVHHMNSIPITFESIRWLTALSLLPAVPVILAAVPFEAVFDKALKLLP